MVEAEHTIKYRQPVAVPAAEMVAEEEIEDDPEEEIEDDPEEEIEEERPRRAKQSFRDKLRKKLDANGIGGTASLKLRIDRLPYYEADGRTGLNAEKEFVRIIDCQEDYVLNDNYLDDVAKTYGPGAYWFTLRHGTSILRNWHKKVSGPPIPGAPTSQANDGAPLAAVQAPLFAHQFQQPHTQPQPRSFKQELKEFVETQELMRRLYTTEAPAAQAQPQLDPDTLLLQVLSKDEAVMERVSKGVLGKLLGEQTGEGPTWAEVAMEAIKTKQAAPIVESIVSGFFTGISNLIPKGNVNGQPQMVTPPTSSSSGQENERQIPANSETQPQSAESLAQSLNSGMGAADQIPTNITPEEQALRMLLDNCARQLPPQVAYDRLMLFADQINDQAPAYSIDSYFGMFARLDPQIALQIVNTAIPSAAQITSLPHAPEWTRQLQELIKADQGGEEDGDTA
jgi:hypothetical protein